jgi:multiple sugar transport system substrate-binding protein
MKSNKWLFVLSLALIITVGGMGSLWAGGSAEKEDMSVDGDLQEEKVMTEEQMGRSTEDFAKYPRAADYLTGELVSPLILERGNLPDDYLFPNDWVKRQDWDAIREEYGGTTLEIIFEGTDIGAPLMTKEHFERLSGIKLNFTGVPNQVQMQKLLVSFATGSAAFDVTVVLVPNLPVFVRFLEPLDDLIEKWDYDFDDYFPHFQSLMTDTPLVQGGRIYGVPNDYDQHYFHCQKKYIDAIGEDGPPETWDEVVEYSQKMIDQDVLPDGVYPLGFMMSRDLFAWESFWDVAAAFGANYFEPGTWEPAMDSPEAIKAANFLRSLIDDGYLHPGSTSWPYTKQLEAWNGGKFAMCIQYPIQESYNPQTSSIADEPRYHSVLPKGPGSKGRIATHGTFTNVALALNKQSEKKDAAFIWMAFANSTEVQYITTVTGTGIDYGRKSVFANKTANQMYPNAQASFESIPYIYNDVQIAPAPEIHEIMIPAFHDIYTGKGRAEDILPKANEQVRQIMQKYGYLDETPPVPAPESFWNWDLYPEYHDYEWKNGVGTGW